MTLPRIWFRLDGGPTHDHGAFRLLDVDGKGLTDSALPHGSLAVRSIAVQLSCQRPGLWVHMVLVATTDEMSKLARRLGCVGIPLPDSRQLEFEAQWDESLSIEKAAVAEAAKHADAEPPKRGPNFLGGT